MADARDTSVGHMAEQYAQFGLRAGASEVTVRAAHRRAARPHRQSVTHWAALLQQHAQPGARD